jgi:hypothetical protein
VTPGNPTEHVYLLGVGQAVGDGVGNELQQRVSAEILEVVDVRLHLDAVHPIDLLGVLLVERELDVRLAELDLLETARRVGMEKTGVRFGSKLPFHGRPPHLVDYGFIGVAEETVLRERLVPQDLIKVIEGSLAG